MLELPPGKTENVNDAKIDLKLPRVCEWFVCLSGQ